MSTKNQTSQKNQAGIVSIVVTMILMVILSLIVIGFSRFTRREQRQALDRQLSTQAYYAAETGVNDAVKEIQSAGFDFTRKYDTQCDEFINDKSLNNNIDGSNTVSYTCLFVNPAPSTLEYSNIDTDNSKIINLKEKNGGPIHSISLSWEDKNGGPNTNCANGANPSNLPPAGASWTCDTGMLRVDLVPVDGVLNRNTLTDTTMTVFLYPSSNSSNTNTTYPANTGFGNQGSVLGARCNSTPGPKFCNFRINDLGGRTSYMLRIKSIYRPSTVTVTAYNSSGAALEMIGAQALVDSTGRANDVLRRIQVRVPTAAFGSPYPEFPIQSVGTLCKRFEFAPLNIYNPGSSDPSCNVLAP